MFGLTKYALIGALAAITALSGLLYLEKGRSAVLSAENARLTAKLQTCSARITNITEDAQSDATVTDPSTFDVPDGWLMPDPRTSD